MATIRLPAIAAAAAALTLLAGGCGEDSDTERDGTAGDTSRAAIAARPTVGVSLPSRTDPFFRELEAGMTEAADAAGVGLSIANAEFDLARQRDQIHDFILNGVSAVVVTTCDADTVGPALEAANDLGIPVFTAGIACRLEGVKIATRVVSDNETGGRLAARTMAGALDGTGEVAIIDQPEVAAMVLRVKGFEHELVRWQTLEVVAKLSGGGFEEEAYRSAEDLLQAYPELDGIFCVDTASTLGALAAVEQSDRRGGVAIIGFGAPPAVREAVAAGWIHAAVAEHPRRLGRRTIEAVHAHLSTGRAPREILVPCSMITRENAPPSGAPPGEKPVDR